MKIRFLFALLAVLLSSLISSPSHAQGTAAQRSAILAVLTANTRALNNENLNAYMATLDPRSPGYATTRQFTQKLFDAYNLRVTINSARVSAFSNNTAQITFDQSTAKISGPAFKNNRLIGVHTLRFYNGAWRFYATRVIKVTSL